MASSQRQYLDEQDRTENNAVPYSDAEEFPCSLIAPIFPSDKGEINKVNPVFFAFDGDSITGRGDRLCNYGWNNRRKIASRRCTTAQSWPRKTTVKTTRRWRP
jgi:hypothetical protein